MAKRIVSKTVFQPGATADAVALVSNTYLAVQGGSSSQLINIMEVYLGGQAGSSAPMVMLLRRDSTIGATTSFAAGGTDSPLNSLTAALAAPPVTFDTATTAPVASSTHLLNLTFNAFGGIVRWLAAPGEEIVQYGNAVSVGETSLSGFTGTTATTNIGAHIVYEPF